MPAAKHRSLPFIVVCLALCASAVIGGVNVEDVQGKRRGWCGHDQTSDWVCRSKGAVFKEDQLLPKRLGRKTAPGSKISTGPNSLARLALRNQAHCVVGGDDPTEVHTRTGLNDALLTQTRGSSSCTMPKTGQPVRILCGPGEPCPAELQVRGTVLINVPAPSTASASTTQVIHRNARIVLCSGFVRVKVETGSGYSEAASGTSGTNRYVVIIEVTIIRSEEDGVVTIDESASLNVVGTQAGPGRCAASIVQEEEESVY